MTLSEQPVSDEEIGRFQRIIDMESDELEPDDYQWLEQFGARLLSERARLQQENKTLAYDLRESNERLRQQRAVHFHQLESVQRQLNEMTQVLVKYTQLQPPAPIIIQAPSDQQERA